MALSPNGKTLASGSINGTVMLWDIETGKVIAKWKEHTQTITYSVCWSPDGERVVSGCKDGTARVWDVESREAIEGLNPIKTGHKEVYAVSYSPKATMIATGGYMKEEIKIWDAKTGKLLSMIQVYSVDLDLDTTCWSLTWTSDEKKLIAGSSNGPIRIFDTATWHQIAFLDGHRNAVYSLTLFQNNRLLASISWDDTARLWNLDTNLQVGPPLQHEKYVYCAAFSADGLLLSTACADENAYVWDIHAILKAAGLKDLLTIPDAQKSELKKKSLSGVNATRHLPIRPAPRQVPAGFFDNVQDRNPPLRSHRHAFAPSWGSRPLVLLARLSSLFRRSRPDVDEPIELQQRSGPSTSSRPSPPVVEVPALDDKKALYTARRPERASDKARRIKNPKWWARVVLFLCCASPSTNDSH